MNNCTEHSSMFTHLHGRSKRSVNNDHGNVGACRRHAGKPDLVADRGIDRWLPGRGSDARRGLRHRRGYHRWPHWGLHRRMVVWPAWREHRRWSAGQHYYGFYWCLYLDFPPASFFASLSVPETVSRPRGGAAREAPFLLRPGVSFWLRSPQRRTPEPPHHLEPHGPASTRPGRGWVGTRHAYLH